MQTQSLWEHTLTFFPQFLATLRERVAPDATVAVVGASDGKFVLPLAAAGYRVVAIERDAVALHGGAVHLPGDSQAHALGLIDRLKLEELHERVEVVEDDFWTASPWACSATRSGRAARGTTVPTTTARSASSSTACSAWSAQAACSARSS